MSVFNVGLFSKPNYSAFSWTHGNRISLNAGSINVIASEYLDTGEKFELKNLGNVIRQAPMVAPTLDTYRCDVHAFAVRLRTLGMATKNPWVYEDFFNLQSNTNSKRLPYLPLAFMYSCNGFKVGTLFEQLGFPVFKATREHYLNALRASHSFIFDPVCSIKIFPCFDADEAIEAWSLCFVPSSIPSKIGSIGGVSKDLVDISAFSAEYNSLGGDDFHFEDSVDGPESTNSFSCPASTCLIKYLFEKYPDLKYIIFPQCQSLLESSSFEYDTSYSFGIYGSTGTLVPYYDFEPVNLLDKVYELYKVDSASVLRDFEDYLLQRLLALTEVGSNCPSNIVSGGTWTDALKGYYYAAYGFYPDTFFAYLHSSLVAYSDDVPKVNVRNYFVDMQIPAYYFHAYWKIISDWYINTAVDNPDSFYLSHVAGSGNTNLVTKLYDFDFKVNNNGGFSDVRARIGVMFELFNRYWPNDYFMSSFPTPQAGQAVSIPVNGTIVDLRNANALQKLRERLLYAGSRFRDVLYSLTGKRTSSAIMDMSEVIGSWSNTINVDSVLQQSASENGSPQANYAGTGLGFRGGSRGASYVAEEPTVIMFVCSIVPKASYFQGLHRKFTRCDVYDYDIPQLANVGEEPVYKRELYLDVDHDDQPTLSYQRRNGSFMWTPDEVHGDFQTSLDFWHNARIFGSCPQFQRSLLQINPKDDNLNRIFAVNSDSVNHFYCHFTFEGSVIRHLPKHVHYDL